MYSAVLPDWVVTGTDEYRLTRIKPVNGQVHVTYAGSRHRDTHGMAVDQAYPPSQLRDDPRKLFDIFLRDGIEESTFPPVLTLDGAEYGFAGLETRRNLVLTYEKKSG